MAHVPHLFLPGPWVSDDVPLGPEHSHHLDRVLRMRPGEEVSYTDGAGRTGRGRLGDGAVVRGDEREVPPPRPRLTLAVAPPAARERTRFLVEKLAELGVSRLVWLATRRGEGRPPRPDKVAAWVGAGLEQSRGAWAMEVVPGAVALGEVPGPLLVADPEGAQLQPTDPLTVAVGPEGGWDPDEVPPDLPRVGLGERILRVETAALAVAARVLLP